MAQDSTPDKNSWLVLPVLFYTPETRWGYGAAGTYNFSLSKEDSVSPPSQLQLVVAYTQEKQLLSYVPFQLYWKKRLNGLKGEIGYFRYSYFFFGIGNDDLVNADGELYEVEFPRVRVDYKRKVQEYFFLGTRFSFEDYHITETEEGGLLEEGNIPGSEGSTILGLGLTGLYDTRDNVYSSQSGSYLEFFWLPHRATAGANYNFDIFQFDARHFLKLGRTQVLGLHGFIQGSRGEVPFSQMPKLGGGRRLRGYYTGRFRDTHLLFAQTEFRTHLFRRFSGTAFIGSGGVANSFEDLNIENFNPSYGVGIRYTVDPKRRVNLRFDAAFGTGISNFYFTVGEAF